MNVKNRGPVAFQWSLKKLVWEEIGDVTGKAGSGGGTGDGGEFDFVTEVVITPEWSATLKFNRDGLFLFFFCHLDVWIGRL